jgi:DNA polymerase-1
MIKKLLIDGDIILYKAASSAEEVIDWGNDWWTLHGDMATARQIFDTEIQKLRERLGCSKVVIALSDPKANWRKSVLPTYKSNRKGNRKPVVFVPLREYSKEKYDCVSFPTLEADDVLGLLSDSSCCIVSDDKDLKTIPGSLYIPHTDELLEISDKEASRYHLVQTLTGDSTDGYGGCPGIGPVKADRVLEEGTWNEVVKAYERSGLCEEIALTQARVARILRGQEYNQKTQEVNLWEPT